METPAEVSGQAASWMPLPNGTIGDTASHVNG